MFALLFCSIVPKGVYFVVYIWCKCYNTNKIYYFIKVIYCFWCSLALLSLCTLLQKVALLLFGYYICALKQQYSLQMLYRLFYVRK